MVFSRFDLAGKTIIVTGAAGLLGRVYVCELAQAGANVVAADLDFSRAQEVAEEAQSVAGNDARVLALQLDVTSKDSTREMARVVKAEFATIDALVNNAALDPKFDAANAGKNVQNFENYPLEMWQAALDVNVTGMFLCAQAVAPMMLEKRSGTIVNISSIYGMAAPDQRLYAREGETPQFKPATYSVTKSAVHGFTRYLAALWGSENIRVNTLTLGGVWNEHDEEFSRRYGDKTPLGRMARKEECAGPLMFLLSDAASYMTGANLVIDGGWTAW